jgi:hypothetical protein
MNTIESKQNAVRRLTDAMTALGLLDNGPANKALDLQTVGDAAEAATRNYETLRRQEAKRIGQQLATKGFDETRLLKAAATMPSTDAVELIASEIRADAVTAAHALTFARVREVPAAITDEYGALRERAEAVEAALANVRTPQAAIDAGKTADWQALADVQATYAQLASWVLDFRAAGLIVAPSGSTRGAFWNYRQPLPTEQFHQAQAMKDRDGGRALVLLSLRCEPYVPASRDEALETANRWAADEAAA